MATLFCFLCFLKKKEQTRLGILFFPTPLFCLTIWRYPKSSTYTFENTPTNKKPLRSIITILDILV